MAIDTSIYGGTRQAEAPDLIGMQQKAATLSQMNLQNQALQDKVDQDHHQKSLMAIGGAVDSIMKMPKDQWETEYNKQVGSLVNSGYLKPNEIPPYSEGTLGMIASQLNTSPQYQELKKAQYENAMRDPNSDASLAAQKVGQKLGYDMSGLSSEQTKSFAPLFEKNTEAKMRYQDRDYLKNRDRQDKIEKEQDKSYTTLRKDLETFRGNQAAQQAARDVYSADKTLAMVANKDPNTLTTQDLSLLASEMAKIATGGVPSEHGVQQLMPNNLSTKFAEIQSFLTSKPTDAQAAEYIRKNMDYLKEMSGEANKVLTGFRGNILKGYKNRIKQDDYNETVSDYNLGGPQAGSAQSGQSEDSDKEAIAWAKQNFKDPRAKQILKMHGML